MTELFSSFGSAVVYIINYCVSAYDEFYISSSLSSPGEFAFYVGVCTSIVILAICFMNFLYLRTLKFLFRLLSKVIDKFFDCSFNFLEKYRKVR